MMSSLAFAYETLSQIYKEGAYLTVALPQTLSFLDGKDKARVARVVYGVIEKHEEFSFMLEKLCKKSPRPTVRIILRMGMYLIKYADGMPEYAAVNECVELTKGYKKEMAGFVNATLKNYIKIKDIKPEDKFERLSYETNYPVWLIHRYFEERGEDAALKIINAKHKNTHLRLGKNADEKLVALLEEKGKPTPYGYLVGSTEPFAEYIAKGEATIMALDSIKICKTLCPDSSNGDILDLCAAPGGKSVYLAENNPNFKVYAQDVHPHRVELIKKYAARMGVDNVVCSVADSREENKHYLSAFSYVLVDAPCSGVGVVNSDPDILINRAESSIVELNALQSAILSRASTYVKKGGRLVYSTCSNLKCENEDIINSFLSTHKEFTLEPSEVLGGVCYKTFANDEEGNDGFFVALMTRTI